MHIGLKHVSLELFIFFLESISLLLLISFLCKCINRLAYSKLFKIPLYILSFFTAFNIISTIFFETPYLMNPDHAFSSITPQIEQISYFPRFNNKHLHIRCFTNPYYNNNITDDVDDQQQQQQQQLFKPKTILFEAGTPFYSTIWGNVLTYMPKYLESSSNRDIIKQYCVYDRYGYGWSDFKGEHVRADQMVSDLQQYLGSIGINDGIIFVGWSYGGILAQEIVVNNPSIIDGVVLVDSMDIQDLNDTLIQNIVKGVYSFKLLDLLKLTGVAKLYGGYPLESGYLSSEINLDQQLKSSSNVVYFGSDFLESVVFELQVIMDSLQLLKDQIDAMSATSSDTTSTPYLMGDIPLVVLTALDNGDENWMNRQVALAGYSTNSIHLLTNSSHFIPIGSTFYDIIVSIDKCITLGLKK